MTCLVRPVVRAVGVAGLQPEAVAVRAGRLVSCNVVTNVPVAQRVALIGSVRVRARLQGCTCLAGSPCQESGGGMRKISHLCEQPRAYGPMVQESTSVRGQRL